MSSFMYFLCAVLLLVGLLIIGGYLGKSDLYKSYSTTADMSKLVNGQSPADQGSPGSGGCSSCRWY